MEYHGEIWKVVPIEVECINKPLIEVSNFGRIRTSNTLYQKKIIRGSTINGYPILRLKLFKEKNPEMESRFALLLKENNELLKKIKSLQAENALTEAIEPLMKEYEKAKKKLVSEKRKYTLLRTIYFQPLIHTLVATHFCNKPSPAHTIIGHLDYNKLNNRSFNLKWMTPDENYKHQRRSPLATTLKEEGNGMSKLTVIQVKLIKKLLLEGKPVKTLSKNFKVTDTQIKRIMKGENWKNVKAAE
jgi:hypothetical protein